MISALVIEKLINRLFLFYANTQGYPQGVQFIKLINIYKKQYNQYVTICPPSFLKKHTKLFTTNRVFLFLTCS